MPHRKVIDTPRFAFYTFLLLYDSSQIDSMCTNSSNLLDMPRRLNPRELSLGWSTWDIITLIIINSFSHRKVGGSTFDN